MDGTATGGGRRLSSIKMVLQRYWWFAGCASTEVHKGYLIILGRSFVSTWSQQELENQGNTAEHRPVESEFTHSTVCHSGSATHTTMDGLTEES